MAGRVVRSLAAARDTMSPHRVALDDYLQNLWSAGYLLYIFLKDPAGAWFSWRGRCVRESSQGLDRLGQGAG